MTDIVINGNRRIPAETIRTRIFTHAGDVFDLQALYRDFNSLWNTGYFEDLRFEREDTPKGCRILVYVREKPNIRGIDYTGLHSVSQSDVLERYKAKKVGLLVESSYDPAKIMKAQLAVKEVLAEHGRPFASVQAEVQQIPPASVRIVMRVTEGPKVKVGHIRFDGNRKFSNRQLRGAMKNLKPIGIPHSMVLEHLLSRTYDASKLSEDAERVRDAYQQKGYFKALVQDPKTNVRDSQGFHLPLMKKRESKAVDIVLPIEEGELYRLKEVKFSGNTAITNTDALRRLIPMKDGEIFNTELVRKGIKNLRDAYAHLGYINFTPVPNIDIHEEQKLVTLTFDVDEGKQFSVRRIEFQGNTTTRDKVIRRELGLQEGQLYDSKLWEFSLLRLNQLGYFEPLKPEQDTKIDRNDQDGTIDITLKVKEKGKNSIGMNGGVSGLNGSFIGLNYETNNFLGLGQTLRVEASVGSRQRIFLIGFTEPYVFDRSYSLGFTIFDSQYRYDQQRELSLLSNQQVSINPATEQNYTENSRGMTVSLNHALRRSLVRVGVSYGYSISNIDAKTNAAQVLFQTLQYRNLAGPSALRGIRSSKITPSISYNTIDNPMNPSRGKSFYYALDLEGVGGNARSVTQIFEGKWFRPVNHRNVLGFRLQTAFTIGWGGVEVSPNRRFYTGGDDSIRGFDIRSISPIAFVPVRFSHTVTYTDPNVLNSAGSPISKTLSVPLLSYTIVYPGGDTQTIGNFEYRIPLVGPASVSLFADAGVNGVLRRSELKLDANGLSQLRAQFPDANISSSLQLLPHSNFLPRTSTGVEFVVQLPVVQAPFRIYWAFNPTRYTQTVTAPASSFYLPKALRASLPPGVYEQQIVPAIDDLLKNPQQVRFAEKRSTFRFSVSRSF